MDGQNTDSAPPLAAAAAASAAVPSAATGVTSSSSLPTSNSMSSAAAVVDAYSALITPTKAVSEGQPQPSTTKETKRQLQLTVDKKGGGATAVVLKNDDRKKKPSSSSSGEQPTTTPSPLVGREATKPSSSTIKWPPVSSTKSLPPLTGRVANLVKTGQSSSKGKGTIEFEVNQECKKSVHRVIALPSWLVLLLFATS
jgi:hypothetical protein